MSFAGFGSVLIYSRREQLLPPAPPERQDRTANPRRGAANPWKIGANPRRIGANPRRNTPNPRPDIAAARGFVPDPLSFAPNPQRNATHPPGNVTDPQRSVTNPQRDIANPRSHTLKAMPFAANPPSAVSIQRSDAAFHEANAVAALCQRRTTSHSAVADRRYKRSDPFFIADNQPNTKEVKTNGLL